MGSSDNRLSEFRKREKNENTQLKHPANANNRLSLVHWLEPLLDRAQKRNNKTKIVCSKRASHLCAGTRTEMCNQKIDSCDIEFQNSGRERKMKTHNLRNSICDAQIHNNKVTYPASYLRRG